MQISTNYNIGLQKLKFTGATPALATALKAREYSEVNPFDNYMESQAAMNATVIRKANAVTEVDSQQEPYKNNLKTMINNNQCVIMAIIPRMFGLWHRPRTDYKSRLGIRHRDAIQRT